MYHVPLSVKLSLGATLKRKAHEELSKWSRNGDKKKRSAMQMH